MPSMSIDEHGFIKGKKTLWDRILEAQKNIPMEDWDLVLPDGSTLHDVGSCHDEIRRLRKENDELKISIEQLRICKEFKVSHGARMFKENRELRAEIVELTEQRNGAEVQRDIISDYMDVMRPYIQSQKKPFSYKD